MTSANPNGIGPDGARKSPEQIELEIARTRSAITGDLLELSEKLNPEHLREGAREVAHVAREEAKELLREAKSAALGSLRELRDRAQTALHQTARTVGERAREASALTFDFVSAHALAMALLGTGAGWLLLVLRQRRRLGAGSADEPDDTYRHEHYSEPPWREEAGQSASGEFDRGLQDGSGRALRHTSERLQGASSNARHAAGELRARAGGALRRSATRTRELAPDHRATAVALTVFAGLGVGLLLPIFRRRARAA